LSVHPNVVCSSERCSFIRTSPPFKRPSSHRPITHLLLANSTALPRPNAPRRRDKEGRRNKEEAKKKQRRNKEERRRKKKEKKEEETRKKKKERSKKQETRKKKKGRRKKEERRKKKEEERRTQEHKNHEDSSSPFSSATLSSLFNLETMLLLGKKTQSGCIILFISLHSSLFPFLCV
jgi:hypothetical protein